MSLVSPQMVKELRERTGVGMGKCKEALEAAKGDINEAIDILRRTGMASAVKKESRDTNEGVIVSAEDANSIILVEFRAETDFVVQNDRFKTFVQHVTHDALKHRVQSVEALLSQKCSHHAAITVDEYRAEQVQSLGENIKISKVALVQKVKDHSFGVYSHMGGKILTLVEIKGDAHQAELAKAIAMHVAAEAPEYLNPEDVPQEILDKEADIARSQVIGKPEQIQEKIIQGKLNAYYDQFCLTRQKYVRDNAHTVQQILEEAGKKQGKQLSIVRFYRWQIGV
jgi:elongation factor Ts